ncbi:DUF624 domain-containing protein [Bifidobacterium apri]|uniref:DUF624 domain-containing protein n=1 Tax=Bifidobacterium apri TaxID=1769423 RepID=UPI003993919F
MALANAAWTVCSLPVVTIGASTQALYEVARAIDNGETAMYLNASGPRSPDDSA